MAAKRKTRPAARSAITGHFLPLWRAKANPNTTVVERIPIGRHRRKRS